MPNKILNFGKFKGKDYATIFSVEPTYLAWAANKGLIDREDEYVQKAMKRLREERLAYDRMDYCNE